MPNFDPDIALLFGLIILVLGGVGFIAYKAEKEQKRNNLIQ